MNLSIVGWKIWYADGTTYSSAQGTWVQAPSTGIEVVTVYYAETYQIARGGVLVTENYVQQYFAGRSGVARNGQRPTRKDESADYFWYDASTDEYGAGALADVPVGLGVNANKTGTLLSDEDFFAIYNVAKDARVAP